MSALGQCATLNLEGCTKIKDVSSLGRVHTLCLKHCRNVVDVSALGTVHSLDLSSCKKVTSVGALGTVHTLNLRYCPGTPPLPQNTSPVCTHSSVLWRVSFSSYDCVFFHKNIVKDCQRRSNFETDEVVWNNGFAGVRDISALGKLNTLNVSNCKAIADFTAVQGVPNLRPLKLRGKKST